MRSHAIDSRRVVARTHGRPRRPSQDGVDETVRMLADWVRSLSSGTSLSSETVDGIEYRWRGAISDGELVALTDSYGGWSERWWDRIRPRSLAGSPLRWSNGS
jgi:hypothetical protein